MNEYDIWTGLTELTPVNYFLGIGAMSLIFWIFGLFRKDKDGKK